MNITIVGAGNMGLAMTGYISYYKSKQHNVTLYTNKKILEFGTLYIEDIEGEKIINTDKFNVTNSLNKAFADADIIFCTYPAFLREQFINEIKEYLKEGVKIGFVPGYGGAEYICKALIDQGITVFGLQRVPYVARYTKTDKKITAGILSKKKDLYVASLPKSHTNEIASLIENLLDIPCHGLSEYLAITLAPSNPLLHLTGLYNAFKNYKPGTFYDKELSFYGIWNDDTSEMLLEYDDELQKICQELSPLDLKEVVPLKIYYESPDKESMTRKLKSIKSFEAVRVPLKKLKNNKYIPDLESRMFIEDYPYGICIIKSFALITGVNTPTIDKLLKFYEFLTGIQYFKDDGSLGKDAIHTGIPFNYGLTTKQDILDFYKK